MAKQGIKIFIDQNSIKDVKNLFKKELREIQQIADKNPIKLTFGTKQIKDLTGEFKKLSNAINSINKESSKSYGDTSKSKNEVSKLVKELDKLQSKITETQNKMMNMKFINEKDFDKLVQLENRVKLLSSDINKGKGGNTESVANLNEKFSSIHSKIKNDIENENKKLEQQKTLYSDLHKMINEEYNMQKKIDKSGKNQGSQFLKEELNIIQTKIKQTTQLINQKKLYNTELEREIALTRALNNFDLKVNRDKSKTQQEIKNLREVINLYKEVVVAKSKANSFKIDSGEQNVWEQRYSRKNQEYEIKRASLSQKELNAFKKAQIDIDEKILIAEKREEGQIKKLIENQRALYQEKLKTLQTKYGSAIESNPELSHSITNFQTKLNGMKIGNFNSNALKSQFNDISRAVQQSSRILNDSERSYVSFGGALKSTFGQMMMYAGAGSIMMGFARAIQNGVKDVIDLNSQIATLRITMDGSNNDFDRLANSAQNYAKEMGTSVHNVMEAVKVYTNMNENVDSLVKKTQASVVLSNLSGIDTTSSTDSLQALSNQFKLTENDSMRVVDSISKVSANMAMDFGRGIQEITDGIKASGSYARQAGFDLEKYESILGSIIESSRLAGSQVGNAMKTIVARMGKVKDPDIKEEDISKVEGALKSVQVTLRGANHEFRNTDTVLDELSKKWSNMTNIQKNYIAQEVAGIRQANIFMTMMDSWGKAVDLNAKALDSQGFALERNKYYLQSTQAKIEELKTTFTVFWQNLVNSQGLNLFISGLTKIVSGITSITSHAGVLGNAFALLFGSMTFFKKDLNIFGSLKNAIVGVTTKVVAFGNAVKTQSVSGKSALNGLKSGFIGLKTVIQGCKGLAIGFGNILAGLAIGFVVEKMIGFADNIIHKEEKLKEANKELIESAESNKRTYQGNIDKLNSLAGEYEKLSGKTSRTAQEQGKYKEICNQIAEISPAVVAGYDKQGCAILNVSNNLQDLIEKQKRAKEVENLKVYSNASNVFEVSKNEYNKKLEQMEQMKKQASEIMNGKDSYSNGYSMYGGGMTVHTKGLKEYKEELQNVLAKSEEGSKEAKALSAKIGQLSQKYGELSSKVKATQEELSVLPVELSKVFDAYLETRSQEFAKLDENSKKMAKTFKESMDISKFKDVQSMTGELDKFIGALNSSVVRKAVSDFEALNKQIGSPAINSAKKYEEAFNRILATLLKVEGVDPDIFTKMFKKDVGNLGGDTGNGVEEAVSKYKTLDEVQKELVDSLYRTKDEIKEVNAVLDKHAKTNEWDYETILKLAHNGYPQLLSLLGNEKELTKKLIEIKNEKINKSNEVVDVEIANIRKIIANYGEDVDKYQLAQKMKSKILETEIGRRAKMQRIEMESMRNALSTRIELAKTKDPAYNLNNFNDSLNKRFKIPVSVNPHFKEKDPMLRWEEQRLKAMENAYKLTDYELGQKLKGELEKQIYSLQDLKSKFGNFSSHIGDSYHDGKKGNVNSGKKEKKKPELPTYNGKPIDMLNEKLKRLKEILQDIDKEFGRANDRIKKLQEIGGKDNLSKALGLYGSEKDRTSLLGILAKEIQEVKNQKAELSRELGNVNNQFYKNWGGLRGKTLSKQFLQEKFNQFYGHDIKNLTKERKESYDKGAELYKKTLGEYENIINAQKEIEDKQYELEQRVQDAKAEKVEAKLKVYDEEIKLIEHEKKQFENGIGIVDSKQENQKNYEKKVAFIKEIIKIQQKEYKELKKQDNQLKEQLKSVQVNGSEWGKIVNRVRDVSDKLLDIHLAICNSNKEIRDAQKEGETFIKSVQDNIVEAIKKRYEEQKKIEKRAFDERKKALDEEHKDKMEKMQEEHKTLEEYYKKKLKMLDRKKDDKHYETKMDKMIEDKMKLQKEYDSLLMDDSLGAKARKEVLKEELQKAQKAIDNEQFDRDIDLQKKNINDLLEESKKGDKEKEKSENKLHEEKKKMQNEELKRLDEKYEKLLKKENLYRESTKALMNNYYKTEEGNIIELTSLVRKYADEWQDGLSTIGDSIKRELVDNLIKAQEMLGFDYGLSKDEQTKVKNMKHMQVYIDGKVYDGEDMIHNREKYMSLMEDGKHIYVKSGGYIFNGNTGKEVSFAKDGSLEGNGKISSISQTTGKQPTSAEIEEFLRKKREEHNGFVSSSKSLPNLNNNYSDLNKNLTNNVKLEVGNLVNINGNVDNNSMPNVKEVSKQVLNEIQKNLNKNGVYRGV